MHCRHSASVHRHSNTEIQTQAADVNSVTGAALECRLVPKAELVPLAVHRSWRAASGIGLGFCCSEANSAAKCVRNNPSSVSPFSPGCSRRLLCRAPYSLYFSITYASPPGACAGLARSLLYCCRVQQNAHHPSSTNPRFFKENCNENTDDQRPARH